MHVCIYRTSMLIWYNWNGSMAYEFWRDPTPFPRTRASRMAYRLRQTSMIFRHLEIPLAHQWSKWTNPEASNLNLSIYYIRFICIW